jgi:hypothetical protein
VYVFLLILSLLSPTDNSVAVDNNNNKKKNVSQKIRDLVYKVTIIYEDYYHYICYSIIEFKFYILHPNILVNI